MNVYYYNIPSSNSKRDFHLVLENIALYLKKYKNANLINKNIINREFHTFNFNNENHNSYDCELVIHDPVNDVYRVISFADQQTPLIQFLINRNNPMDILLCSQVYTTVLPFRNDIKLNWKYSIYTPTSPYHDLDALYIRRMLKTEYIDKMFFRGNVHANGRGSAKILKNYSNDFEGYDGVPEYFEELTDYKVGLSLPGVGQLCFRDIEYMAIGIPMLRFEYVKGDLNPPLIPNFHYISIDRIDTPEDENVPGGVVVVERNGSQKHVDCYLKRFNEVRNDKDFLNFISKNARDYYEKYLHPSKRIDHLINLLDF